MKKIFIMLLLGLCSVVFGKEVYKVEFDNNKHEFIVQDSAEATTEITQWIIADVIKSEKIQISSEDLEKIAKNILSALNVTYENFCKPNIVFLTKIHDALAKVVAGSDPKLVYEQDITEEMMPYEGFLGYVKRYNTKELLEEFSTQIPTSMEIVVKSFIPQAKELTLYWLLYRKIISSSQKNYDSLSVEERKNIEKEWWQKKLKNLIIVAQDKDQQQNIEQMKQKIVDTITVKKELTPKIENVLVEFFNKKL